MKKKKIIFITFFLITLLLIIFYGKKIFANYYDSNIVYVTKSDSKYHLKGCDYLNAMPYKTTVRQAENMGFSPCKHCDPYGLATEFYGLNTNYNVAENLNPVILFFIPILYYLLVPIIYKLKNKTWDRAKDVKILVTINSFVVASIYLIIAGIIGMDIETIFFQQIFLAPLLAFVNYRILKGNILFSISDLCTTKLSSAENENLNSTDMNLSMTWFNFWKYIRFPLGIILTFSDISGYLSMDRNNMIVTSYSTFFLLIEISFLVLIIVTYYCFIKHLKIGYILNLIVLVVQSALNISGNVIKNISRTNATFYLSDFIESFFPQFVIMAIIWILPNYIYFKRRKYYFYKNYADE